MTDKKFKLNKIIVLRGLLKSNMKKKLTIELSSNLDYEGMVVDINYNSTTLVSINYDKGIHNMEMEFFPSGIGKEKVLLSIHEFSGILKEAEQLALKCFKEDQ